VNKKNNTNITYRAGSSTFDSYIHVKNEYGFKYMSWIVLCIISKSYAILKHMPSYYTYSTCVILFFENSGTLEIKIVIYIYIYNLTALKSNSNTVWFNFQTYIYIYGVGSNPVEGRTKIWHIYIYITIFISKVPEFSKNKITHVLYV
jgi:flagellar hook protein FlgE